MRAITTKAVQEHFACVCGLNEVYTEYYPIRWQDLSRSGIVRRKSKPDGKPFLLRRITATKCRCYDNI